MAGSDLPLSRGGAPPSNPPLRQPFPPRSTPGRVEGRCDTGRIDAGSSGGVGGSSGKEDHGDRVLSTLQSSHFEPGGSSNQGGRNGEWRDNGFNGQSFGDFEEGYFEGNNGYGNGYGSLNCGNFRPRPYNNYQQQWNRGYNNNYRGGSNRFNGGGNRAQKKLDKMQCLRCGENGHFAEACTVELCLYCEKTSHESQNCPLLSMPKPVAITYGVSLNELMFREVPASSEVTFKHDSGKVGKISLTGGRLDSHEIIKELEWINPADVDKFHLTEVWVRVHGCCYKERCDYLSLFGVGSLIGKTKEIDMAFTRAHSVVQMNVEVTRVEHIPTTTVDHTYDGEGYGLIFKLEGEQVKSKDDVAMQDANPDDDSKNGEGKNKDVPKGSDPKNGPANH
ncbi:hypothetical protein ACQ4PT_062345 [Festuca glaucescens]